tara:strand:- start:3565 stop:4824 length:1260 start_codon:yes stop_codon:yes gene_type:complete
MLLSTYQYDDMFIFEHTFEVPLNYTEPEAEKISVFVRELRSDPEKRKPYLIFFQGGPGFESPRPITNSGWIKCALERYDILLLDQRGTGRSTPVTIQTIGKWEPQKQANYLQHFRADNIVNDAEHIRQELNDGEPWSILGQSFGGFCAVNYLSFHAHGLKEVMITGGIPPLSAHPDEIYRRTYKRVKLKNEAFFSIFPEAQKRACQIADHIQKTDPIFPDGDTLTVERFQLLGLQLGFSDGYANLNYLFEHAFADRELSYAFLKGLTNLQSFDTNPFFTILHEACYAQKFSTNWSANKIRDEFQEFDPKSRDPFLFTGEMLYPWMLDQFHSLTPLRDAAHFLAEKSDWPALYHTDKLLKNSVPVAAAVYTHDMYVDRDYSMETAESIQGIKVWETDEYEHNGLRSHGKNVLQNLFKLLD